MRVLEYVMEVVKGIGRMFINPLFYWIILLFFVTGYQRIKKERKQFGRRIFPPMEEAKFTWGISVISSLLISILAILFGLYFSNEIMLILIVVLILLSITASPTLLSASYTIGLTYILAVVLPFLSIPAFSSYIHFEDIKVAHFITLAFLMGILLFVEGLIVFTKKLTSFPSMAMSKRGVWIGKHHIKKLAFIPFFVLIPATAMPFQIPIFPYLQIGEQQFMLALLPFVIGVNYQITSSLPAQASKRIGQATMVVSLLVWICAIASLYYPILSFAAILVGIIGKEWVTYQHKRKDQMKPSLYHPLDKGIKVLAVIPESPAARLGIQIGETILKVNGSPVLNKKEFYEALQNSGAFFKLAILDIHEEIRFVNSPFYEEDHHALGIVFAEEPYHIKVN